MNFNETVLVETIPSTVNSLKLNTLTLTNNFETIYVSKIESCKRRILIWNRTDEKLIETSAQICLRMSKQIKTPDLSS